MAHDPNLRKTVPVDAELLYTLLDMVSVAPEQQGGYTASAKVPWSLINDARAYLDEHGVGPNNHNYDWRYVHYRIRQRECELRAMHAHPEQQSNWLRQAERWKTKADDRRAARGAGPGLGL